MSVAALAERLRRELGDDAVLHHPVERYVYGKDAGLRRAVPELVVLPTSTEQVAAVVKAAADEQVAVVPRGGGSGITGGAVPSVPAVLVVLTRMDAISDVDPDNRTAWVGPGVINLDLSAATAGVGLHFAPDPSSQSVCTIGGNVANNSGGPHCLAEGSTVSHILALEVVLASGEVVVLGGPAPDPPGLDLRGVIVGSEGTLGIVTRVLVKLTPNPPEVRTLLMEFAEVRDAAETVSGIIGAGIVPAALELMDRRTLEVLENFLHIGLPTDAAAVLLCETTGHRAAVDAEAEVCRRVAVGSGATNVRLAADEEERAVLWRARKAAFGAVAQLAPDFYLHDTVVPRTRLPEVLDGVYEIAERHGLAIMNVFHAGDGNLHPIMGFDLAEPGVEEAVYEAGTEIIDLCLSVGGALTGEHGIGTEKRDHLPKVLDAVGLDAQARLREAFDPDGLFNPEHLLPAGSRCADFGRPIPEGAWV